MSSTPATTTRSTSAMLSGALRLRLVSSQHGLTIITCEVSAENAMVEVETCAPGISERRMVSASGAELVATSKVMGLCAESPVASAAPSGLT